MNTDSLRCAAHSWLLAVCKQKTNSPRLPTTGKQIPEEPSEHSQGDRWQMYSWEPLSVPCAGQGLQRCGPRKAVHKTWKEGNAYSGVPLDLLYHSQRIATEAVSGHSRKQQKAAWLIFLKWKKRGLCCLNSTVQMVFSILHALSVVAMSCLWLLWPGTLTSQQLHHCLGPNELRRKKLGCVERPQLGEISHTQQASATYINRADRGKAGGETKHWGLERSTWGPQSMLNHVTCAYRF